MILEYELTAEDIRQAVLKTLKDHRSLETEGYRCTMEMALNVLLKAAVDHSSLEAACADLEQVTSSSRLREQLNQALEVADLRQHEYELNAEVTMVATLPRGRDGRRRRKRLMFVLVELDWSPHTCKARYRRRFGIECLYRQGRQVRIITNSMILPSASSAWACPWSWSTSGSCCARPLHISLGAVRVGLILTAFVSTVSSIFDAGD